MDYTVLKNTRMTNRDGIMEFCLYFGLENLVKSNTRLYFYRYDIYNLVEIDYRDNLITIYIFPGNPSGAERIIIDDLAFYEGYFNTAGLKDKRFIFDIKNKMPVRYDDFIKMDNLFTVSDTPNIAFVLDIKDGYITSKKEVNTYISIENNMEVDNCILSLENDLINFTKPVHKLGLKNTDTIALLALISGLLSGISITKLKEQVGIMDLAQKFLYPIKNIEYNSDFVDGRADGLRTGKFRRIIENNQPTIIGEIIEKEFDKNEAFLKDIIDIGLDKFMNTIKNPNKVVKVIIDCEWQTIKSMYIVKGAAFITPAISKNINYYYELFDSDNVQFVMN